MSTPTAAFPLEPTRILKGGKPTAAMRRSTLMNPCAGCPLDFRPRVYPVLPQNPLFIMVGACPSTEDTGSQRPGSGPAGNVLRTALNQADLVLGKDVGFINLTRCQALDEVDARIGDRGQFIQDIFETKEWFDAVNRCSNFLRADLLPYKNVPLVPLGTRPLQHFLKNIKTYINKNRGLRRRGKEGETLYPTWNPTSIFHKDSFAERQQVTNELNTDICNVAQIVRGTGKPVDVQITCYHTREDIIALLEWLAEHPGPWAFDIETYDAVIFPSREEVATDPCHPDFRVRGIGIAWAPNEGGFLDLIDHEHQKAALRPYITKAFRTDAPKWAANGHFDEEGLIYPGWTDTVWNRAGDSMLAMIAASTGRLAGFSLERGIVDVLHEFYHWADIDKTHMRELSTEIVADGCVRDACGTWRLCDKIHAMMAHGEYLP